MKKIFFFLLPLIITALCFLGETSILKAQTINARVPFCPQCDYKWASYCKQCGGYKSLTSYAHICDECFKKSGLISGHHSCGTIYNDFIKICYECAKKNQCLNCGKYLGSGEAPGDVDNRKVVERYTVRITIPGKKEEFMNYFNKGWEAINNQNYQEALNQFKKCDEIIPNGVAYSIGIALKGLKRYEEALTQFDIVIKEEPAYNGGYFQKGLVMITLSKFSDAEPLLKKAIQLNIQESNAYLMYAYLMESDHKDYDQAIKYYEKGFELSPKTSTFRGNLINLYQQAGRFDDALRHANILCELLDNSIEALTTKAELLFNSQKWNDAIPIYEKIISMNPNNIYIAYYYLGLAQYQVNQYKEAKENWEKAIEKDENNNPEPYACLAICEMKLNNPDDAEKYCEKTLELLKRESSFVFYNLACAYSMMNKVDKSLDVLEKALKTGQVNIPYMESDADLKNVRAAKGYKELMAKYK